MPGKAVRLPGTVEKMPSLQPKFSTFFWIIGRSMAVRASMRYSKHAVCTVLANGSCG